MSDFYKVETGYVLKDNVWSITNDTAQTIELGNLKPGDVSSSVRVLQNALRATGYYTAEESSEFNPATQAAVQMFQEANGLEPTGIVDNYLWTLIQEAYGKLQTNEVGYSERYNSRPPGKYIIRSRAIFSDIQEFICRITCNDYITVKRTCVVYYSDSYVGYLSKVEEIKDNAFILSDFDNAFMYNPKHGNPDMIEYIIYPYGRAPHKFIITIE